eukprot:gene26588-32133_t
MRKLSLLVEVLYQIMLPDALVSQLGLSEDVIRIHPDDVEPDAQEAALAAYGLKVLGSYVGTDQYIQRNLLEYVSELNDIGRKLTAYLDLPGRLLLLFRLCFATKPFYIYRTIPPHLSHAIYCHFEEIKMKILANILGFSKREHLKEISYRQAQRSIPEGGLKDERGIAMSAYCASVLMWANSQPQTLESFLLSPNAKGDLRPRPNLPVHLVDFISYLEEKREMLWFRVPTLPI